MKLAEFKKLIKEAIEEEKTETTMEMMEPIDNIGTFMIVKKIKCTKKWIQILLHPSIFFYQ